MDRPPCGAGAARSGHQHQCWPGPVFVVVNVAAHILDHAGLLIIQIGDDGALAFAAKIPRQAR